MEIRWQPYIWEVPHPVDAREIAQLEEDWGITFPEEYKQLVARYQGMTPDRSAFHVGRGRDIFCALLILHVEEGKEAYSARDSYALIKPYVPAGIYPFGTTPGDALLCFDYRDTPDTPRVVLVSVDMNIHPVANSFREFLESLHDGNEPLA